MQEWSELIGLFFRHATKQELNKCRSKMIETIGPFSLLFCSFPCLHVLPCCVLVFLPSQSFHSLLLAYIPSVLLLVTCFLNASALWRKGCFTKQALLFKQKKKRPSRIRCRHHRNAMLDGHFCHTHMHVSG